MWAPNINAIYKVTVLPTMEGDAPVLTDRKDIKMWKRLKALEKAAAKGSKKNVEKLRKIIQEIKTAEGYANPKIVVKVIDLVDIYLSEELQDIMLEILEKCQLTDCVPQLQAATKLVGMGSFDYAKSILNRMTVISDVPQWEYLHALVDKNEGNTKSALAHFSRIFDLDDRFIPIYSELEDLDPEGGWFYRGMIASIMNGETPSSQTSTPDGRMGELYNAYWEYSNGGGPNAIDSVKRMVREGIETDVELALARFYFMDKKYAESVDYYNVAAQSKRFHVMLEYAEALLRAGNYFEAQNACIELEGTGISDRRLIELMIRIATAMEDRSNLVKYVKVLLYNDYADYNAYKLCVEAYIKLQMHSEASLLLEEMSALESDDPMINLLLSKNDYASGRYPAARATARKAVRKMPNDIDCLLHISRVYMSLGRPEKVTKTRKGRYKKAGKLSMDPYKKALKYIDAILQQDPRNRDAMLLKKDVLIYQFDYDGACLQCQNIITYYPDDSQTMKDLAILYSKMGREKDSIKEYRKCLDVKEDPILFMDIITSLARTKKYEEVVELANDYDDVYGNNVDMWVIKGNAEYQTGKYDDAIESFTRAVEMDHRRPSFWHSKGMAEEMAGEYELAEISYDKAVLMDLDNPEYWISKSSVQEKRGDYAGAINSLNRVITAHPENVYSLMRKAIILVRLNKISEARKFIELASMIEPLNMKITLAKRDIYYREGDLEATKKVCRDLLTSNPGDKQTAIILASILKKNGILDEAHAVLVVYNVDPNGFSDDDYKIHRLLREIYHEQGKTHEEISACKTILSFRPDDRETKTALAEAYIKRGMIEAAKTLYDELHLQSPEESDFSLKKAMMAEDDNMALSMLMESLTRDPDNVDVLIEVARRLRKSDRCKDALVYVKRALDNDPTVSEAYVLKMKILYDLKRYRELLSTAETAASNARVKDPIIWKMSGDAQMNLKDYQNALISYDTATKLGIATSEVYHSRGMCQEALGMDEAAINSYTIAYQKDPSDTESMIRIAAIYLKQNKDQSAGRILDQAISVDPLRADAIVYRATIFASRSNESGVKKLFDHCVSHGIDEDTKQTVAELMEKARNKEVVAMPIILLVMPEAPEEEEEAEKTPSEPEEQGPEGPEIDEAEPEEEEPQDQSEAQEETSETTDETAATEEQEPEEGLLEDGFVVDDDSGFVMMSDEGERPAEEEQAEEQSFFTEEPAAEEINPEEEPQEQSVAEQQPATDDSDDISFFAVDEEPEEEPQKPSEEPEEELSSSAEESEEPSFSAEPEQTAEEEPIPESLRERMVEDYATRLLECAHNQGEIPSDDKMVELAGIPKDMVDDVFNYLSDIKEYGSIDPNGSEFRTMEQMSHDAIVDTNADDIEDDPVISLTSAYYESGAKDIDTAKKLVAYIYAAMTVDIDTDAIYDKISDIVDDVEFNGTPKTVFGIMSKYRIGVYEARAVKSLAFKKDGSVVGHI